MKSVLFPAAGLHPDHYKAFHERKMLQRDRQSLILEICLNSEFAGMKSHWRNEWVSKWEWASCSFSVLSQLGSFLVITYLAAKNSRRQKAKWWKIKSAFFPSIIIQFPKIGRDKWMKRRCSLQQMICKNWPFQFFFSKTLGTTWGVFCDRKAFALSSSRGTRHWLR